MVSDRLRAFVRDYASRPPGTHGTREPTAMGSGCDGRKQQTIQYTNSIGTHRTHGTHENDDVRGNRRDAEAKDPGPWLLLRLWTYGAMVEAAPQAVP